MSRSGFRNTAAMMDEAEANILEAVGQGLMHTSLAGRRGKHVALADGRQAVEFLNCSYLGLDVHPQVVRGAVQGLREWGVHFCCARSRLSIGSNTKLEAELSDLFGGRAVTFPSVTAAHLSVMPLIASGALLPGRPLGRVRLIFDRLAHASMQSLKPLLAEEAEIVTVPHCDLDAITRAAAQGERAGQVSVYVGDGVYSMGGLAPMSGLLELCASRGLGLYLDDAHGTSVFGPRGEGFVRATLGPQLPPNVFIPFSLAKGFGCNGGGVLLPDEHTERLVRHFGQTYAFSAPLDFSIQGAALAAVALHRSGEVARRQARLRHNVALFDRLVPTEGAASFSPIRFIPIGRASDATALSRGLLEDGYYVSPVFFPVVARGRAGLRVCVAATHTRAQIRGLATALQGRLSAWRAAVGQASATKDSSASP